MIRVTTIIVLAVFFPMQLYAVDFGGFGTDTQIEYFVPRPAEKPKIPHDQKLTEKMLEEPPKVADAAKSGTNWWLWGGLAVVAGGVAALAGGGGGSKSSSSAPTGSGTVSW